MASLKAHTSIVGRQNVNDLFLLLFRTFHSGLIFIMGTSFRFVF